MTSRKRPVHGRRGTGARDEASAGGVVFRVSDSGTRFLLIRDSYGNWGFPKGHLERGERADVAAVREVMEETGLRSLRVIGPIATIDWRFRFRGAVIHKSCQFFLMESQAGEPRPQLSEGITACRWVSPQEAAGLIVYENTRDVLRRAREMVAARVAASSPPDPATSPT